MPKFGEFDFGFPKGKIEPKQGFKGRGLSRSESDLAYEMYVQALVDYSEGVALIFGERIADVVNADEEVGRL